VVELRELLKVPVARPVVIDLPKSELIVDETGSFMRQRPGK
jgi:hypothetical protein